jgi:hypothetical protein
MARWITLIIFGGAGLGFLYVGVTQYFLQRRLLANAIMIEATIVKSEVFKSVSVDTDRRPLKNTSTNSYRADIRFRYSYGGQEYDGAAEELKPFPLGARVPAYLNVDHPDKAYLVQEKSAGPMVFMILGVLLPPLAWFVGKYV